MRAAVAYRPGEPLVIEDVPVPTVGPRDVLVRIAASGICHTDVMVMYGQSALPLPIVPGHEACGTVEEIGAEVRRVRVGDRVLASVSPACGTCWWWCIHDMSNHCELGDRSRRLLSLQGSGGKRSRRRRNEDPWTATLERSTCDRWCTACRSRALRAKPEGRRRSEDQKTKGAATSNRSARSTLL